MFRKITALLFCAVFCFGSGVSTMPANAASEAENVFVEQTLQTYDGIYMQVKGSPADNYRKIGIVADEPLAYSRKVRFGGELREQCNLERPSLLFCGGKPEYLFNATGDGDAPYAFRGRTYILVQKLTVR